jgi:hypothetical protein
MQLINDESTIVNDDDVSINNDRPLMSTIYSPLISMNPLPCTNMLTAVMSRNSTSTMVRSPLLVIIDSLDFERAMDYRC